MSKRRRRARQPEVVINALFRAAPGREDTGDRFSIWVVLLIALMGLAAILAIGK